MYLHTALERLQNILKNSCCKDLTCGGPAPATTIGVMAIFRLSFHQRMEDFKRDKCCYFHTDYITWQNKSLHPNPVKQSQEPGELSAGLLFSVGTPCRQLSPYSRWCTTQPEKYAKPHTSSGSFHFHFSVRKTSSYDQWGGLTPWRAAAPGPPAPHRAGWHPPAHTSCGCRWLQCVPVTAYSNTALSFPRYSITPKGQISLRIDNYKMRWLHYEDVIFYRTSLH